MLFLRGIVGNRINDNARSDRLWHVHVALVQSPPEDLRPMIMIKIMS